MEFLFPSIFFLHKFRKKGKAIMFNNNRKLKVKTYRIVRRLKIRS